MPIVRCPYGVPGNQLWVRESAYIAPSGFGDWLDCNRLDDQHRPRVVGYAASMDGDSVRCAEEYGVRKTPSIHMPRWASRITLEITDVRVERVADISEEDAAAEGVAPMDFKGTLNGEPARGVIFDPRKAFAVLWDQLNADRGFGWDANPFVWALTFRHVAPSAAGEGE